MREQLEWFDPVMLRVMIVLLDPQNWCVIIRSCDDDRQGEDEDILAEMKAAVE